MNWKWLLLGSSSGWVMLGGVLIFAVMYNTGRESNAWTALALATVLALAVLFLRDLPRARRQHDGG